MRSRIPKNIPQKPEKPPQNAEQAARISDEVFWQKLDKIAAKEQTVESTREFVRLLYKGYHEDRNILIYGSASPEDETDIHQIYTRSSQGRNMLYLTDRRHINYKHLKVPAFLMAKIECFSVPLFQVIDNALEKAELAELRFNPDTQYEFIIPAPLLRIMMEL